MFRFISTMSKFLEERIYRRLEIAYEEAAEKANIPIDEVEKCPPLFLRQVACMDKAHQVLCFSNSGAADRI